MPTSKIKSFADNLTQHKQFDVSNCEIVSSATLSLKHPSLCNVLILTESTDKSFYFQHFYQHSVS